MQANKAVITKNKTFVICFSFFYLLSFLFLFTRKGVGLYFHPFCFDSFMDMFCMTVWPFNPTYPPFPLMIYKLAHLMTYSDVTVSAATLRSDYQGSFFLMAYILAFSSFFLFAMYFSIKGSSKRKVFYSVLFLCSGIVLWTIERANIIAFAFLLSLLFVTFYCDGNENKKRLSFVFIALAISLKFYPGAFLLLLVEKKDVKGIVSVALEVFSIFVFSFIICQYLDFLIKFEHEFGLHNYMKDFRSYAKVLCHLALVFLIFLAACFAVYEVYKQNWKNVAILWISLVVVFSITSIVLYFSKHEGLLSYATGVFVSIKNALVFGKNMTASLEGVNVSFKNLFLLLNFLITKNTSFPKTAFIEFCKYVCVAFCVFSFFANKRVWKKIASMSLLCIYVPDFAATYLLLFLLIPLLLFINDEKIDKMDYLYALLFAVSTSLLILPGKIQFGNYYLVTTSFIIMSLSVFSMFILLVGSAFYELIKEKCFVDGKILFMIKKSGEKNAKTTS